MRKFWYYIFASCAFAKVLNSGFLRIIIPPVVALYYGILDIWGEDWKVIKNNIDLHETIFCFLAISTIFIVVFNAVSEKIKATIEDKVLKLQKSMSAYCNDLVKAKSKMVKNKAKHLKPKGDPFKLLINPNDQLERSIDEMQRLLENGFEVSRHKIGITIISFNKEEGKWKYLFKNNQTRQHTAAQVIMERNSTANYCHKKGESLFVSDIRKGLKEQVFYASDRSKEAVIGSLYCRPVNILVNNISFDYIFTVAVYGEFLCTPYDANQCEACNYILDDIANRIEMELYLLSVQEYRAKGGVFK